MKKKTKIKNCIGYGVMHNKSSTKGVLSLIIPDNCMPLEKDDIKIEVIPSRDALRRRGLLSNDKK